MTKPNTNTTNLHPKIAVTVRDDVDIETVQSLKVDILELRVDQFSNLNIDHIIFTIKAWRDAGIFLLLTVRNSAIEGGEDNCVSDEKKLEIFQEATSLVEAVDIELTSPIKSKVIALAKQNKKLIIVSSHNFVETPTKAALNVILHKSFEYKADIVKIAAQANSFHDVITLIHFTLEHKNKKIITIALGSIGSISRLVFPLLGSLWTYSYIDKPSAPGQIPIEKIQKHLHT